MSPGRFGACPPPPPRQDGANTIPIVSVGERALARKQMDVVGSTPVSPLQTNFRNPLLRRRVPNTSSKGLFFPPRGRGGRRSACPRRFRVKTVLLAPPRGRSNRLGPSRGGRLLIECLAVLAALVGVSGPISRVPDLVRPIQLKQECGVTVSIEAVPQQLPARLRFEKPTPFATTLRPAGPRKRRFHRIRVHEPASVPAGPSWTSNPSASYPFTPRLLRRHIRPPATGPP